jgi:4-hydroxybenzoate polyprenyltransferase
MSCGSSVPLNAERGRVVEQKELTKGKAALLLVISALIAIVSATHLHGWHVYLGLGIAAAAIFFAFTRWNRKY